MRLLFGLVLSIASLIPAAGCRDVLGIHAARSGDADDLDDALDPPGGQAGAGTHGDAEAAWTSRVTAAAARVAA